MDWRVAFGLGVSATWITAGLLYLLGIVGWDRFLHLPTADIGSFLEGAFAPLAFLWLVIGHFMQQKEITANTKAINLQEMSARRLELHSRRDSYFKLLSLVQDQLGAIAAFHYMSVCGPTGTGEISQEEFAEQRSHATAGDHAWFIRKMITLAMGHRDDPEQLSEIFFGTEVRRRHSDNFSNTFAKLLNAARQVDTEEMVTHALLYGSASGMFYRIIRHASGDEAMDPITGLSTAPQMMAQPEVQS
ncbi:hypothetical protein [Parahaliea aestuarii]|uniref:DUF4760 domain-containing protein n=1 Tax=Parahaliea aestuarii TaxID=1852021 RepID=A0A5C9A5Q3_9GAMM|nr:hypothetical protein [Parahaliea aestuarii]TXS94501.1 hypothetical protein FVW59_00855 [Parahaliea aestuarii]